MPINELPQSILIQNTEEQAQNALAEERVFRKSSLLKIILLERFMMRVLIVSLALLAAAFGLFSPFFLKMFVDRFSSSHQLPIEFYFNSWPAVTLLLSAVAVLLIGQFCNQFATFLGMREAVITQKKFSQILYSRLLSLRSDAFGSRTTGEIVAIYATDVQGATALLDQSIPVGSSILFPIVLGPIAVHWLLDVPLTVAVSIVVVVTCISAYLSRRQSRFFHSFKQLAAERTGLVSEWIQNIRTLRILGWVSSFEEKIFRKREQETRNRVRMVTNGQVMSGTGSSISFIVNLSAVASLVYVREGHVTPGEILTLLWVLGVFLSRPFRQIPWVFTYVGDALSSLSRLSAFLTQVEEALRSGPVQGEGQVGESKLQLESGKSVEVQGLSLVLGERVLLDNINFEAKPGEFVAIVGELGSGKSLFALSLLGETGARCSSLKIDGVEASTHDLDWRRQQIGFVPQESFVMSASLRENIGFDYDLTLDHDAQITRSLETSQFRVETENIVDGLSTEIGERGINLSGGQRQRISLARAHFYSRPIIILDDCLSAVDVDTEKHLLDNLIEGAWKNKTRILITHRLSVLERVDRIYFLEKGRFAENGSFQELVKSSPRFRKFVHSVVALNPQNRKKAQEVGNSAFTK